MVLAASGIGVNWYKRRFGPARDAGIRVEVVCIATHEAWSRLGSVARYATSTATTSHPGHQCSGSTSPKPQLNWSALQNRIWTDQEHRTFLLLAEQLLVSPITTEEQKIVVVDAVVRSLAPNQETIDKLTAADHAPERVEHRLGYLNQLTALAQEWASQHPPWHERPQGNLPSGLLRSSVNEIFRQYTVGFDKAAHLRGQIAALLQDARTAAVEGRGHRSISLQPSGTELPQQLTQNDAQRRLDAAQSELRKLRQQLQDWPATIKKAQLEILIHHSLAPSRAASEQHERSHLRQHPMLAAPGSELDPESLGRERDDTTEHDIVRVVLQSYPQTSADLISTTPQLPTKATQPTPNSETGFER